MVRHVLTPCAIGFSLFCANTAVSSPLCDALLSGEYTHKLESLSLVQQESDLYSCPIIKPILFLLNTDRKEVPHAKGKRKKTNNHSYRSMP